MNRVLVVVWNDFTNDKRVNNICNSLAQNGYDVTLLATKQHKGLPTFAKNVFKLIRIPMFSSLYSKRESISSSIESQLSKIPKRRFFDKLKRSRLRLYFTSFLNWFGFNLGVLCKGLLIRPKVIYANDLDTLTVSYILSKLLKTKLIFDSHELWLFGAKYINSSKFRKEMWKIIHKLLIIRVDEVIVTTSSRANYLIENSRLNKVNVIKNCPNYDPVTNSDYFRNEFRICNDIPILVYQGSLIRKRGIFTIVDIAERINEIAVVFMGMGNDKCELLEYIKKKKVMDRVFIRNPVHVNDVVKFVSSADIGLQIFKYTMNHYTVISNKLFECIMAGIAVIASDFPEIRKVVSENEIGILVDPENEKQIEEAIRKLVTDRELLKKFKANSVANRHKYTWEIEEKKLLRIFENLNRVSE